MTEWVCPECEWAEEYEPTAPPEFFCSECGSRRRLVTDPDSLADKETMTDKI